MNYMGRKKKMETNNTNYTKFSEQPNVTETTEEITVTQTTVTEETNNDENVTWTVTQEDDGVHVRPVVDGKIIPDPDEETENEPETPMDDHEKDEEPEVDKELKTGVVDGTAKLYVRSLPSKESEAVTIIEKGTEVKVDEVESTADFYKVYGNKDDIDFTGYCVKQFIKIK